MSNEISVKAWIKKDKEFPQGFFAKKPHEKAPDFVKVKVSIKRKDFGNWLRKIDDDWINIDIKESKSGAWYAVIDDWKPEPQSQSTPKPEFEDDDLPF